MVNSTKTAFNESSFKIPIVTNDVDTTVTTTTVVIAVNAKDAVAIASDDS